MIERRRLKSVRGENDLTRAASARLGFRCRKEPRAEAFATVRGVDPENLDLAAIAPRPAVQSGEEDAAIVSLEDGEERAVVDAGSGGIELVDTIVEKLQVGRSRVGVDPHLIHAMRICLRG